MSTMNPVIKTKWLEALRSGEYQQGRVVLRTTPQPDAQHGRFCCLGVLCDLIGPNKWTMNEAHNDWTHTFDDAEIGSATTLTEKMREHVGLDSKQINELIERNDAGEPFSAIADHIEWNL